MKISLIAFFCCLLILSCNYKSSNQQIKTSNKNNIILWTANWSADGQFIAVGGADNILRIYDGKTFELIKRDTLEGSLQRLRWHPKDNILAVGGMENTSRIIDFDKDKTIILEGVEELSNRAIAWNRNGELLAIADYEKKISIWNKDGKLQKVIRNKAQKSYVAIDWHPLKDEIIALSDSVKVFDIQGNVLAKFDNRKEDVLMLCVKWHPSGKFFVIGDYGDYDVPYKPLLQFWNADYTPQKSIDISKGEFRNVSWSADGSKLATASDALRIWSKDGELLHEGKSPDFLWGIDWSPNGKYIVTSSMTGLIKIWNDKAKVIANCEL